MLDSLKEWWGERMKERTSLDGAVLIATAGSFLLFEPIAHFMAWVALIYGIWSVVKEE